MQFRRSLRGGASAAVVVLAALSLAACGGSSSGGAATGGGASGSPSGGGSITIAAFNFGESKILASAYAGVLRKAGYAVTVKELGAREVVQPALEKGSKSGGVDIVPEYLSTFTEFINKKANGANAPAKSSGDVQATLANGQTLANAIGITLLTPSPATDQNAFAVTQDFATKNNLTTLSDLASYTGTLTLGGPPECPKRPFCQPGLESTYGLKFAGFTSLDAGGPLTKKALQQDKIQIGLVFSSDGGIDAFGLKVLEDDKKLQAADNIVPAVNTAAVNPELKATLDRVSAAMTTEELVALNKQVDIDGKKASDVAQAWLSSKGLV